MDESDPRSGEADPAEGSRHRPDARSSRGDGTPRDHPPSDADRAPLSDLAREIGERRSRRSSASDPFEEIDVEEIDGETVWDLLSEAGGGVGVGAEGDLGADPDVARRERRGPSATGHDHVVPKAAYCERCQHLSAPPELACGREGTEIIEVVDSERFRVRGCPFADADFGGPGAGSSDADSAPTGTGPTIESRTGATRGGGNRE